jgi:hypothetical protein
MKFILISLLFPTLLFGQTKIEGIGPFLINKTTIAIFDSLKKAGYKYSTCDGLSCNHTGFKVIVEHVKTDKKEAWYTCPVIDGHQKFLIGELFISGFDLLGITMEFYKDTLIDIVVREYLTEFTDAITLKYGKPKFSQETKTITCRSKISGIFKVEEKTSTWTYRNDRINAFYTFWQYYNDKCEKQMMTLFSISDVIKTKKLEKLTEAFKVKSKKEEDRIKKQSLDGL